MYILAKNMWFTSLIKQFFFSIDKIVYNFISSIYDVLITIARTSILSQADIADMADRIYKLLAIFMVFKVTLSLITYVVNPDDFSDKSKGLSKLTRNIIISLALLILTPYIFSYAYQLQTIILEDNSLSVLIFGEDAATKGNGSFFNSAGDKIAYTTISPFFSPNLSLDGLIDCDALTTKNGDTNVFNDKCYEALKALVDTKNQINFSQQALDNYKVGVENGNFGLMFRQDLAIATDINNENYIMDYKYIFSTVVGVVIILLLITFCMDIAIRSIKLAFLQLVAPIPIISYVDPKSGKDGLFKKWYDMCFKTYLSLFIRLIALYFAVYIISKVADMRLVDIVDGSYVTNGIVSIFVIIGALMFAKQLPEILKGLGIKLDGAGKFTLNPFKKFEEEALGAKRVTGAAGGLIAGAARGRILSGAIRGFAGNKGFSGGFQRQADVNRKIGEAKMNRAGFLGSRFAGVASAFGMENIGLENDVRKLNKDKRSLDLAKRGLDAKVQERENEKKRLEDQIKPAQQRAKVKKSVSDSGKALVDFAKNEISGGKADGISTKSKYMHNTHAYLEKMQNQELTGDLVYFAKRVDKKGKAHLERVELKAGTIVTPAMATEAEEAIGLYENKVGALEHLEVRLQGKKGRIAVMEDKADEATGLRDFKRDDSGKIIFRDMTKEEKADYTGHDDFVAEYDAYQKTAEANGEAVKESASEIKGQSDSLASESKMITSSYANVSKQISDIETEISEIRDKETIHYEGEDITIAEAERRIGAREKEINDRKDTLKTNVTAYNDRRYRGGSK